MFDGGPRHWLSFSASSGPRSPPLAPPPSPLRLPNGPGHLPCKQKQEKRVYTVMGHKLRTVLYSLGAKISGIEDK